MPDDQPMTAREWWSIGIPVSEREQEWSTDLATPTTTDLAEGHPLNGVSPWATETE